MMEVSTPRIQLENPPVSTDNAEAPGASYPRQLLAHARFILSGLGFTSRWTWDRAVGRSPVPPDVGRMQLHTSMGDYIRLLIRWNILSLEHNLAPLPHDQGCVIAGNHPSLLDALILMGLIPGLDCVMNSKLGRSPVTAGACRLGDFIRNDNPLSMVRACRDRLVNGHRILIFPEGTRTIRPPVGPFHHGFALAACHAGVPVHTVIIETGSNYFGRGFSFFKLAPCPMRFRLTSGRTFDPADYPDARSLSAAVESYLRHTLTHATQTHSAP